jgi:hypothetical protein
MGSIAYIPRTELDNVWENYIKSEGKSVSQLAIVIKFKDTRRKR